MSPGTSVTMPLELGFENIQEARKLSVYCEYDRSHHNTKRVFSKRDRTLLTEEMTYNARGDLASVTTSAAGDGTKKRQLLSYDAAGCLASVRIQKTGRTAGWRTRLRETPRSATSGPAGS